MMNVSEKDFYSKSDNSTLDRRRTTRRQKTVEIMKPPKLIKKVSIAILWPLVLYTFIQVTSNLIQYYNQSSFQISTLNTLLNSRSLSTSISLNEVCQSNQQELVCSSLPQPLLSSSISSNSHHVLSQKRSIFGGGIIYADALQHQNQPFETNHKLEKGIIVLNSTNFNSELIQYKHPFPHIKLIEYYVSFCRFCSKFKQTYINLAKEIYEWRNVLRPSAIDVGVSDNSPIAHSWSVETVPTLRIHPPPKPSLAYELNKQLSTWQQTLSSSDLQKYMFNEYNSSKLMLHSMAAVTNYMEKVSLLKLDLLRYIERYVTYVTQQQQQNNENNNKEDQQQLFPTSWPNLSPVTENNLIELLRNHPRPELFLIIEGGPSTTSVSDQSSSTKAHEPSLGLQILMELSSSAPWKAVRYVKASDNKQLIEDVILQHKRAIAGTSDQTSEQITEQIELLNNLLSTTTSGEGGNTILLVHIDDSHSTVNSVTSSSNNNDALQKNSFLSPSSAAFPFMTIVSAMDLGGMATMLDHESNAHHLNQNKGYSIINRAKRATTKDDINQSSINRLRRSLFSVAGSAILDKMANERKVELLSKYIKQTYTETSEDRDFVKAINSFDTDTENQLADDSKDNKPARVVKEESIRNSITNIFYPEQQYRTASLDKNYLYDCQPDYSDKLKAIRYMLFNEIPRSASTLESISLVEQQEKLNTLINIITVIRAYFPLPDLASIQFIDGVQSYLLKQQSKLLTTINNQQQGINNNEKTNKGFDMKAFKQELKRLEAEEKRLPEIKEYKQCTGYPCAVWRLFHTLTAFEYKKLSQIRQPHHHAQPFVETSKLPQHQHQQPQTSNEIQNLSTNIVDTTTTGVAAPIISSSNIQSPPVERLVSPPSTTTSLSLTIATPTSDNKTISDNSGSSNNKPQTEADLPMPVILVMRDYITNYFSCDECRKNFKIETVDLNLEKIRQVEPAEFSILWLWETHNRVNKRLSVDSNTNPPERPKIWYPSYQQCQACYTKPPTFLKDLTSSPTTTSSLDAKVITSVSTTDPTIFHEVIEWNRQKVLAYLLAEYTRHPMDNYTNIFGYQVPYSISFIIVISLCCLFFIVIVLRCTTLYVERQRRHKATLLNGNGAHYSLELQ